MNSGQTPSGVKLNSKTDFFPGGAVNFLTNPTEMELFKVAQEKIKREGKTTAINKKDIPTII